MSGGSLQDQDAAVGITVVDDAPKRKYAAGDLTALTSLAQGRCYAPGCEEPLFKVMGRHRVNNFQVAHIHALKEGGARFNPSLTVEQRNAFDNVLLLCDGHHKVVDRLEPEKYSAELLRQWKADREAPGMATLLPVGLDEQRLTAIFEGALDERTARLEEAITKLTTVDPDAAEVVRGALEAADSLGHLGSSASDLMEAADLLGDLQGSARALLEAADLLSGLGDDAKTLTKAAESLAGYEDIVAAIERATENLRRARPDY